MIWPPALRATRANIRYPQTAKALEGGGAWSWRICDHREIGERQEAQAREREGRAGEQGAAAVRTCPASYTDDPDDEATLFV